YRADREWVPTSRAAKLNLAVPWVVLPAVGVTSTWPHWAERSKNVTWPRSNWPAPGWTSSLPVVVTVAVTVTVCPTVAGFGGAGWGETVRTVVLGVSRPSSASTTGTNVRGRAGAGRPLDENCI